MFNKVDLKKVYDICQTFWAVKKYLAAGTNTPGRDQYKDRFNTALALYKDLNKKEKMKTRRLLGTLCMRELNEYLQENGYTEKFV